MAHPLNSVSCELDMGQPADRTVRCSFEPGGSEHFDRVYINVESGTGGRIFGEGYVAISIKGAYCFSALGQGMRELTCSSSLEDISDAEAVWRGCQYRVEKRYGYTESDLTRLGVFIGL